MTMYQHAESINAKLKSLRPSLAVLEVLVQFGRVAKYRCRSNIAYQNFVRACLEGVAEVQIVRSVDRQGEAYETIRIEGLRP